MDPKYFRSLEFDQVRAKLATYTAFRVSEELALALSPYLDREEISAHQRETSEARVLLDQQPNAGIGGARDIRSHTNAARLGALLNPPEFLDINATILSARLLSTSLGRMTANSPRLAAIAGRLEDLSSLSQAITRVLNDRGEVVDDASPDLARIRRELNTLRGRIMERLQRMLTTPEFVKYLQEPIITQREGRYVIPIRAEARGRVQGIVHDASASGATLFVEPMAVVEAGNRVRELTVQEAREVERILRALTEAVASHADELDRTVAGLADLDLAFAKAKYSAATRSVEPKTGAVEARESGKKSTSRAELALQLLNARHPLLDPESVVPISIELGRSFRILVITGPNTGGKTVTLKTVGLLVLMAQSGLHIPADEGSQVPVYDGVFADIGDEQSIEQNLSTFSGHMTNIIGILKEADERSLVLLDELGAGTDPVEGSALARSIIASLLHKNICALVATHYAELKAFAHATPGVENASVEFDLETLAPTFHLTIGLPGRSNAFAIAKRLGLDDDIIEGARSSVAQSEVELEKMLAEIKHTQQETSRELARASAEREAAERSARNARRELGEIEKKRVEILRQAHEESAAELAAVRAELDRMREEWRQLAVNRDFIEQAQQSLAAVEEHLNLGEPEPPAPVENLAAPGAKIEIGDQVYVPSLDQSGRVVAISGDSTDVQIGSFRAHVSPGQVELRAKARPSVAEPDHSPSIVLPPAESPGMEVHLRGMRAEDALDKLDTYLDRAYQAGLPFVRIVHGKGTGTLRRLVREQLTSNPLVAGYDEAGPSEGGGGVTIAHLVSR